MLATSASILIKMRDHFLGAEHNNSLRDDPVVLKMFGAESRARILSRARPLVAEKVIGFLLSRRSGNFGHRKLFGRSLRLRRPVTFLAGAF